MQHRLCDQIRENAELDTKLHVLLKIDHQSLVSKQAVVLHDRLMQYCQKLHQILRLQLLYQVKYLVILHTSRLIHLLQRQYEILNQVLKRV